MTAGAREKRMSGAREKRVPLAGDTAAVVVHAGARASRVPSASTSIFGLMRFGIRMTLVVGLRPCDSRCASMRSFQYSTPFLSVRKTFPFE